MILTIHYQLNLPQGTLRDVRRIMRRMRQLAVGLNSLKVGLIEEFPGKGDDEMDITSCMGWAGGRQVPPRRAVGFAVLPGRGCESADIGLYILPGTVRNHKGKMVSTRPSGWRWRDFCKTQYASAPQFGGVDNFLHGHLGLIQLFDEARALGVRVRVSDEGTYWERRDRDALVRELQSYDELIAGFGGELKDAYGSSVTSPIFSFSNFEHLEAKARLPK